MKRGLLILLLFLILIGCQIESEEPGTASFNKLISVIHIKEETGASSPIELPSADEEPESAKGEILQGNFNLNMHIGGKFQVLNITELDGARHRVRVYKPEALSITINPKIFELVIVEYGAVAGGTDTRMTRAKLREVNFIKYTDRGEAVTHTETITGMDTTTGASKSKTINFNQVLVSPNFKINLVFDVGVEGTQEDISTPSYMEAYIPFIVTWQPFPNEKGEDPTLSEPKGMLTGYVFDAYTGQRITNNEVSAEWNPGGARFSTTDLTGKYEFLVPLELSPTDDYYQKYYDLNFKGCKYSDCTYESPQIKQMFIKQHGITDFDYAAGKHYPKYDGHTFLIEANGKLYQPYPWIQDKVLSRERKIHDFYMHPAPPGAYLKTDKTEAKINDTIKFSGYSVQTYDSITGWKIDFGDQIKKEGTGRATTQTHSYTKEGEYTASIQFTTYNNMISPAYTQKIKISKNITPSAPANETPAAINETETKPKADARIEENPEFTATGKNQTIIKGTTITFAGNGIPADSRITKYAWDFNGDGITDSETNTGGRVAYTYSTPGRYRAKFTVTDAEGKKDTTSFDIRVLNADATFEITPSNVIPDGTVITAWYTLHNKDTEDIMIYSIIHGWYHKHGNSFTFSHYEPTAAYIGNVRAGESKVLWKEVETVCCPGTRQGRVEIKTRYGTVKTSLTKTILPLQNATPAGAVTLSSAKNQYTTTEPITVTVTSNMPNTNCILEYNLNNAGWINAASGQTDNAGTISFTRNNNLPGIYQAKATCDGTESNILTITVSIPTPQYTVTFFSSRDTYDYDQLTTGEDHLKFSVNSNMPNAFCDFYAMNIAQGDWSKKDTIPLDQDGKREFLLPSRATGYFIPGMWEAQLICRIPEASGIESNKIRYIISRQIPKRELPTEVKIDAPTSVEKPTQETSPIKTTTSSNTLKKLTLRAVMETTETGPIGAIFTIILIFVLVYIAVKKEA